LKTVLSTQRYATCLIYIEKLSLQPEPEWIRSVTVFESHQSGFKTSQIVWKNLAEKAFGISCADICKICEDAIKDAIIYDREKITLKDIQNLIGEQQKVRQK